MFVGNIANGQSHVLTSGDVTLSVNRISEGDYYISYSAFGETLNGDSDNNPSVFIDTNKEFYFHYNDIEQDGDRIVAKCSVVAKPSTTEFRIVDVYEAKGNGEFELQRTVNVVDLGAQPYINGFRSSFGLQTGSENVLDNEYFIPTVMYRGNFIPEGNIPAGLPDSNERNFCFREDRVTLPVVMNRRKSDGLTITMIHKDTKCNTVLNDSKGVMVDDGYQFGGVGFFKSKNGRITNVISYPGDDTRKDGLGERRHPVSTDFDGHRYKVYYKVSKTASYAAAVEDAWSLGFKLYNPAVCSENLTDAYNGLIETLNTYYMAPPGEIKAPGFPWSVDLTNFSLNKNTYEIGFVGAQPIAGYALFRAGVETGNKEYENRGNQVLNFWALKSLTDLGLPRPRYAALKGTWDNWVTTSIRQACNGMAGILNAWAFAKRNGMNRPAWLNACQRFGDFLVDYQNADGSFYLDYNPNKKVNGRHPAVIQNKFTTVCSLRYLIELYIATGDERYKNTAMKAAEFCYQNIHNKYLYVACVVDNAQTIDSESGQQAINGFLSVYDLTKDPKWLEAAEQAAIYTASWTFMYDIPVEVDQMAETNWPKDRNMIGQHIIAIGHSGADLGFAWSSFVFYRLYLLTGKDMYLQIARISAHNSKQSMNLRHELYPGQPEGLQQEAFTARVAKGAPRRTKSVMQALTWNFAAHLDPMVRFKDAFGTYDLEEVEKMPKEDVLKMNERYSRFQSSDYGQESSVQENRMNIEVRISQGVLEIQGMELERIELFDLSGTCCGSSLVSGWKNNQFDVSWLASGVYMLKLFGANDNVIVKKIRI